jgi:Tol biopolymer transport system component
MKAGGGGLRQVTPWEKGGLADKIDWSPDGARIAFSSPGIGDLPGVSSNVFTVRTDGTGLAKLTHSTGGKVNNGLDSWSPDGNGVSQITHGNESHRGAWGTHP